MGFTLVSDALWERIKRLLPMGLSKPKGGRPRVSDRACVTGVVHVLRAGVPWRYLPKEFGCGGRATCWRRLRDWERAGVWRRVHKNLLEELVNTGRADLRLGMIDSQSVRPVLGGRIRPQTPQIAGKKAARGTSSAKARGFRSCK